MVFFFQLICSQISLVLGKVSSTGGPTIRDFRQRREGGLPFASLSEGSPPETSYVEVSERGVTPAASQARALQVPRSSLALQGNRAASGAIRSCFSLEALARGHLAASPLRSASGWGCSEGCGGSSAPQFTHFPSPHPSPFAVPWFSANLTGFRPISQIPL